MRSRMREVISSPIIGLRDPTNCSPVTRDCWGGLPRSIRSIRTGYFRVIGTGTYCALRVERPRSSGGHAEKGAPGAWDMGPGHPDCGNDLAASASPATALDGRERRHPGEYSSTGVQAV